MTPLARVRSAFHWSYPLLSLAVIVVAVTYIGSMGGEVLDRVVVVALVNLVFVVGLYVFTGNSGVFSFGHMSFAAIGAYTSGILTIPNDTKSVLLTSLPDFLSKTHTSPILATIIGGAIAAAAAIVISIPLMRLSGIGASLATFAVLIIVNVVASNWQQITNGTSGMAGVPTTTTQTSVLVWGLVAILAAYLFQQTRWGLRLKATREDEVAARAAGVGVYLERRIAFVLSAFFTGVGGALYGQFLGSFNPAAFYLNITFVTVAMLVIGGITSLAGAVIGTVFISVVTEFLRQVEEHSVLGFIPKQIARPGLREVGLALIMLLILVLKPGGITRGQELRWPPKPPQIPFSRRFRPRPPEPAAAPAPGDLTS